MKVNCDIEEVELEDDRGQMRPGVRATCSRCDHQTESFGTGEKSRKRCLVLLREECPRNEENFYRDSEEGGESRLPDPEVVPWWQRG
jgi:hypothetical protein